MRERDDKQKEELALFSYYYFWLAQDIKMKKEAPVIPVLMHTLIAECVSSGSMWADHMIYEHIIKVLPFTFIEKNREVGDCYNMTHHPESSLL